MGFQGSFAVGGAIFNVAPDGALRWYRYDGTGQQDPTGGTGWAANSGTPSLHQDRRPPVFPRTVDPWSYVVSGVICAAPNNDVEY